MPHPILHCEPFSIEYGNSSVTRKYACSGFSIPPRSIFHLFAPSNYATQDFLYLITGLQNARELTLPAEPGSLKRTAIQVDTEALQGIRLQGQPIYDLASSERAKKIGIIYENPEIAIIGNTVQEEFLYSFAAQDRYEEVPSLVYLKRYDLYNKSNRRTEVLSGGERHRLNCACALELDPNLLVADFSASNLDRDFLHDFLIWINTFSERAEKGVLLTGLNIDQLSHLNYSSLIVRDNTVAVGDPDPDLYKSTSEETSLLASYLKDRQTTDEVILTVKAISIPEREIKSQSFQVRQGEALLVKGPNGSGKTTLANIISGKMKKNDYEGSFILHDDAKVAVSLQHPERSFVMTSVKKELPDEGLLEICGISPEQWAWHPRKLNKSQRKLLGAAIALSRSHILCILDEPTCGMDFQAKEKFIQLLNHFKDLSLLIITHDPALDNLFGSINY